MDIMEQTLASMEKLERSTLRRSTTVKGENKRRHLCVDTPPKCVVDEAELQREKNTMKPNALLVLSMRGLSADYGKISKMADMLREESYTLKVRGRQLRGLPPAFATTLPLPTHPPTYPPLRLNPARVNPARTKPNLLCTRAAIQRGLHRGVSGTSFVFRSARGYGHRRAYF